jgi:hypothetical protein
MHIGFLFYWLPLESNNDALLLALVAEAYLSAGFTSLSLLPFTGFINELCTCNGFHTAAKLSSSVWICLLVCCKDALAAYLLTLPHNPSDAPFHEK